jgi:hypothetical protein
MKRTFIGYYPHLLDKIDDEKVKSIMDKLIHSDNLDMHLSIFSVQYDGKFVLVCCIKRVIVSSLEEEFASRYYNKSYNDLSLWDRRNIDCQIDAAMTCHW